MNKLSPAHLLVAITVLLAQIFLLKNVELELWNRYVVIILIYPLIILGLPISIPRSVVIVSTFVIGLIIDMFYDSPGVHTAAFVFTGFIRSFVLRLLEPRSGYRIDHSPDISRYGISWYLSYAAIILFIHCFVYFSIDTFTFVYFDRIIVSSVLTFAISYVIIMMYKMIIRD